MLKLKNYTTIKDTVQETVIKRSRFIAYAYNLKDEEDAEEKIVFLRKKHYDATHVCYAYISDEEGRRGRYSDDGEPSGTAGQPMFDALKKSAELHSPVRVLDERSSRVTRLSEKLDALARSRVEGADGSFRMLCARLEGVNPLAVLSHGYAMVQGSDGRVLSTAADATVGEIVDISLSDGKLRAQITEITEM